MDRLQEKLREAQAVLKRDTYNRDKPSRKELAWAKRSPAFKLGDRVLAYVDNDPGAVLCEDPRHPGHWFVLMDVKPTDGLRDFMSVGWDNLVRET